MHTPHMQVMKEQCLTEEELEYLEENLPSEFHGVSPTMSDFLPLQHTKTYKAQGEVETLQLQVADFREVCKQCSLCREKAEHGSIGRCTSTCTPAHTKCTLLHPHG